MSFTQVDAAYSNKGYALCGYPLKEKICEYGVPQFHGKRVTDVLKEAFQCPLCQEAADRTAALGHKVLAPAQSNTFRNITLATLAVITFCAFPFIYEPIWIESLLRKLIPLISIIAVNLFILGS